MSKTPITMTPGDDTHLTLLMSPVSLNFVTGQDREHLLAFGRAAFEAGHRCQGCAVQQGYVPVETPSAEIKEPAQIKPSMSMHVSAEDYQRALTEWQAEQKQSETPQELIARFRSLPVDHKPDGWPAVQTKEITALLDLIAALEAQLAAVQQGVQQIQADCYSNDDGDYWRDCPDDCDFVEGLKVGDTFELQASIRAWSETFRVTKAPDDTSDDYEVELVSSDAPIATHPTQQGLDAQRWQIVHDHISGEYIAGRACFVVHVQPMSGANIMRGSVAEHFTKAVDDIAAQIKIAAQAKQGGEA